MKSLLPVSSTIVSQFHGIFYLHFSMDIGYNIFILKKCFEFLQSMAILHGSTQLILLSRRKKMFVFISAVSYVISHFQAYFIFMFILSHIPFISLLCFFSLSSDFFACACILRISEKSHESDEEQNILKFQ